MERWYRNLCDVWPNIELLSFPSLTHGYYRHHECFYGPSNLSLFLSILYFYTHVLDLGAFIEAALFPRSLCALRVPCFTCELEYSPIPMWCAASNASGSCGCGQPPGEPSRYIATKGLQVLRVFTHLKCFNQLYIQYFIYITFISI